MTPTDNPKLLECLHNACDACVKQKFLDLPQNSIIFCPVCKMENRVEYVIDNQFLSELNGNSEDAQSGNAESTKDLIKCSSCSDDAIATSWCVECSEFICDSCVQAHQRLKITKDHTIKSKEEAASNDNQNTGLSGKNIMCHVHTQVRRSFVLSGIRDFVTL